MPAVLCYLFALPVLGVIHSSSCVGADWRINYIWGLSFNTALVEGRLQLFVVAYVPSGLLGALLVRLA